ncbi:ATP-binding protein [Pseudohongiella spirulinae]|uniref:histidine kinase n=1 Tax=Pseudohongiella spirulinae TaxID=1249552 RepID=A0A0S2KEL8_9GAMM|nr:ATP-binding protein [Pseudohongiella spirulinae]ALO46780.1 histidine kinase [Pseudohongiella spirulinae]
MPSNHRYSLQNRLLLSVSVLLTVFLGLTGVVLDRAFRASVESGVAEQLQVQIYVLLAAVDEADGEFYFSENLREPRFSQLNSGLYGFLLDAHGQVLLRTSSALEIDLTLLPFTHDLSRGDTVFNRLQLNDEIDYFSSSYAVTWENRTTPVVFTVLESSQTYLLSVSNFRASLWSWLGGLAALLLVLQLLLLRWGLAPLRRLARDLTHIEQGQTELLSEDYPQELNTVTRNMNLLIQSERKQQQRYRTTLGDLAHSLKTPLAVIQGELNTIKTPDASGAQIIQEQLEHMNQIVGYQLQRAVRSENSRTLARQVDLQETAERICRALEKVYADKAVKIEQQVEPGLLFLGDERDLMEMLGNLLDNACKYGHGRVVIRAIRNTDGELPVSLVIEDDGPGISENERSVVLERGVRLDTLAPGQGIGMAVVADIVQSYGGRIDIDRSSLGGAKLSLLLPNVRF